MMTAHVRLFQNQHSGQCQIRPSKRGKRDGTMGGGRNQKHRKKKHAGVLPTQPSHVNFLFSSLSTNLIRQLLFHLKIASVSG